MGKIGVRSLDLGILTLVIAILQTVPHLRDLRRNDVEQADTSSLVYSRKTGDGIWWGWTIDSE